MTLTLDVTDTAQDEKITNIPVNNKQLQVLGYILDAIHSNVKHRPDTGEYCGDHSEWNFFLDTDEHNEFAKLNKTVQNLGG